MDHAVAAHLRGHAGGRGRRAGAAHRTVTSFDGLLTPPALAVRTRMKYRPFGRIRRHHARRSRRRRHQVTGARAAADFEDVDERAGACRRPVTTTARPWSRARCSRGRSVAAAPTAPRAPTAGHARDDNEECERRSQGGHGAKLRLEHQLDPHRRLPRGRRTRERPDAQGRLAPGPCVSYVEAAGLQLPGRGFESACAEMKVSASGDYTGHEISRPPDIACEWPCSSVDRRCGETARHRGGCGQRQRRQGVESAGRCRDELHFVARPYGTFSS